MFCGGPWATARLYTFQSGPNSKIWNINFFHFVYVRHWTSQSRAFKSWPGFRQLCLKFFMVFLSPYRQIRRQCLKLEHYGFLLYLSHYSSITIRANHKWINVTNGVQACQTSNFIVFYIISFDTEVYDSSRKSVKRFTNLWKIPWNQILQPFNLSPASYAWARFARVLTWNACSRPHPLLPELAKMAVGDRAWV
jgi:hypothetical protein